MNKTTKVATKFGKLPGLFLTLHILSPKRHERDIIFERDINIWA